MNVQILSRKLITPSSPTPRYLQNLKISWIDQSLSPNVYLPGIFYYPDSGEDNTERSKQLQNSLSETLAIFYPLAGRYTDNNLTIHCNDEGVEYVEAKVGGSLSQLLEEGELETELRNRLAPFPIQPDNSPLVLIQFNMFECGGMAIGFCVTHRVADAYTIFTFFQAWATASRIGVDQVEISPNFQLSSYFPSRDADALYVFKPSNVSQKKNVIMKRFVFKGESLSNLKAVASAASTNGSNLSKHQPTRLEVVTALIWRTTIMVVQARHDRLRPSLLSHSMNLRGKIAVPIPENSCGNLISMAPAHFTPDDSSKMQLHDFVDRVHDGITKMVTGLAKVSNDDELFLMVNKIKRETAETIRNGEVDLCMFNSWCRMPIYETDFGWGKPGWYSGLYVPGVEMVFLVDTKDGDGIEAWVSLEENSMLLFQENPDIVAFTDQGFLQIH